MQGYSREFSVVMRRSLYIKSIASASLYFLLGSRLLGEGSDLWGSRPFSKLMRDKAAE